ITDPYTPSLHDALPIWWLSPALRLLTQSSFQSQSQWHTSAFATSTAQASSTFPAPKPAFALAATSVTRSTMLRVMMAGASTAARSEEHTSELQSREKHV